MLIVVIYSLSVAIIGSALHSSYGFPLDDSYIHQTIARNLAHYGVLGFIPGVPSAGSTSVLWPFIQALNYKFVHVDPVAFNLVISGVILATIGVLLFLLAEGDGLPRLYSFVFAVAPAFSGNFIWLALIAMEHLLFTALALGFIYFWTERQCARCAVGAGTCGGLLVLTRPEALIFALIFGSVLMVTGWKNKRSLLFTLIPWIVSIAVFCAVNRYTSHSLMPATMEGRNWLYFHSFGGPHSFRSLLIFLLLWLRRLQMQVSIWHPGMHFIMLRCFIPLGLLFIGAAWLIRRGGPRIRLVLLFAAAHFSVFLLQFPTTGQGARYQPLNLLLLFPCMFFGLLYLFQRLMKKHKETAAAIAVTTLIAAGAASLGTWRIVSIDAIAHINNTHARAAQWLLNNVPANARVAVFDIGRISYDWNHRVIDLGGLVDPTYTPYLLNHSVPSYAQKQKADYLILPSGSFAADLGFTQISTLRQIARFCSPLDAWDISSRYTGNAEQCQTIYKLP